MEDKDISIYPPNENVCDLEPSPLCDDCLLKFCAICYVNIGKIKIFTYKNQIFLRCNDCVYL